jgi:hypothetical protein
MRNAPEMFSFDPNPTRAKNAWSSSTCLLYGADYLTGGGGEIPRFPSVSYSPGGRGSVGGGVGGLLY